jgi:hypothetical protein
MNETFQHMKDAQGRLVPIELIKPIDLARNDLVTALIDCARELSAILKNFKQQAFDDFNAFVDLSAEQYGVTLGGRKGNVTLTSFDGRFKVVRQIQDSIVFDERLQAAKVLVDECITGWAKGTGPEIRALVNDAFQVDKEGTVNTARVLALKRLEITDQKWQRAMQAIQDSVLISSSRSYMRFYERVGDTDRYEAISLDLSKV